VWRSVGLVDHFVLGGRHLTPLAFELAATDGFDMHTLTAEFTRWVDLSVQPSDRRDSTAMTYRENERAILKIVVQLSQCPTSAPIGPCYESPFL
jgi:hypothetical protein